MNKYKGMYLRIHMGETRKCSFSFHRFLCMLYGFYETET